MADRPPTLDRRTLLAAFGSAGAAGLAGCSSLADREPDAETTDVDADRAADLATRFAPTLYFDTAEPWFPTDPRPYATNRGGETVVDGFDALNGYHERLADAGEPPNRTVFYNVVDYEGSPLSVVQFWLYAAFDQFTANFHWHDWEVLHVFVDSDTDEPQLYVASSHSTRVPNNEFLDPDPDRAPRILSELGSHSSALSVNDRPDEFQRSRARTCSPTSRTPRSRGWSRCRSSRSPTGSRATRAAGSPTSSPSTRGSRCTTTTGSPRSRSRR